MHIISLTPENLWGWYYVSHFTDEETNVWRVRWLPMVTKWWSQDCNTFLSHSKAQREGRKLSMTFPALDSYVNTYSCLLSHLLNCKRKTKGLLRTGEHPYLCWKLGNLVIHMQKTMRNFSGIRLDKTGEFLRKWRRSWPHPMLPQELPARV